MNAGRSVEGALEDFEKKPAASEPFSLTLAKHGLKLERAVTTTLQINVGLLCNQVCRHCHLEAGPNRAELMTRETVRQVIEYATRGRFETVDITGGAPELNPNLISMIKSFAPLCKRLMLRSNLSAMEAENPDRLIEVFKEHGAVVVASFPSLNPGQSESQRGKGIFETSIRALKRLNAAGYGEKGSGLELDLVSNPTGAFLPTTQAQAEKRFRDVLRAKWGIEFNHLYTFANAPLGRFRRWLIDSGNFENYLNRLASSFNPCTIEGLMCRTLVSVSWDGYLHDCDFNLARGLFMRGKKTHVNEMKGKPMPGSPIITGEHCYTCTAGAGFT